MGRLIGRAWGATAVACGGAILLAATGGARAAGADARSAAQGMGANPGATAGGGNAVQAGVNAWSQGDFAAAIALWRGPAARGDADAEFDLGQAYKLGRGVPQDLAKAEALFQRAAAQGHLQAADNYGLLVFQRGDHATAMPYIRAAADRGDPRAQYVLGIVLFNGEGVQTDWVRAYALESLSQQAGWPPAKVALAKMDGYIPLEQRQQAVGLAADLAAEAEATRNRQMASADLRTVGGGNGMASSGADMAGSGESGVHAGTGGRLAGAAPADGGGGVDGDLAAAGGGTMAGAPRTYAPPVSPGTTYAPRRVASGLPPAPTIRPRPAAGYGAAAVAGGGSGGGPAVPYASAPRRPDDADMTAGAGARATLAPGGGAHTAAASGAGMARAPRAPAPAAGEGGGWNIQLGAFGVVANADALWARVHALPALAGHPRAMVPSGKVTRLLATGFNAEGAAAACRALTGAGHDCLATRD